MSSKRYFNFEIEEKKIRIDFGNWVMLLSYAKEIDIEKFKFLYEFSFRATSFYDYMVDTISDSSNKNSIVEDYHLDEDSEFVLFNKEKLKTTILFIESVIENLKTENLDLLDKYGGEHSFVSKIDNDKTFIYLFVYEKKEIYNDNLSNIFLLNRLNSEIFKNSLIFEKPHKVYID